MVSRLRSIVGALVLVLAASSSSAQTVYTFATLPGGGPAGFFTISDGGGSSTPGSECAGGGSSTDICMWDMALGRWSLVTRRPDAPAAEAVDPIGPAAEISIAPVSGLSALTVQAAIAELASQASTNASAVEAVSVFSAGDITETPATATTVTCSGGSASVEMIARNVIGAGSGCADSDAINFGLLVGAPPGSAPRVGVLINRSAVSVTLAAAGGSGAPVSYAGGNRTLGPGAVAYFVEDSSASNTFVAFVENGGQAQAYAPASVADHTDVDLAGIADGQVVAWSSSNARLQPFTLPTDSWPTPGSELGIGPNLFRQCWTVTGAGVGGKGSASTFGTVVGLSKVYAWAGQVTVNAGEGSGSSFAIPYADGTSYAGPFRTGTSILLALSGFGGGGGTDVDAELCAEYAK